jgi:hypothetical protein
MDKIKITGIIKKSQKIDVLTIPSISTNQEIDIKIKNLKEIIKKNNGKEIIIVHIITN